MFNKDLIRVTNKFYLALLTSIASDTFKYNNTTYAVSADILLVRSDLEHTSF